MNIFLTATIKTSSHSDEEALYKANVKKPERLS